MTMPVQPDQGAGALDPTAFRRRAGAAARRLIVGLEEAG